MTVQIRAVALLALLFLSCSRPQASVAPEKTQAKAKLLSVGPRLVSDQTSVPLAVYGEGLVPGQALRFGTPLNLSVPLLVQDASHAFARVTFKVPWGPGQTETVIAASLEGGEGEVDLRFINDTGFPDLVDLALSPAGDVLFAASTTEDAVYAVDLDTKDAVRLAVGDGPTSLATFTDSKGGARLAVAHRYTGAVWVLSAKPPYEVIDRRAAPDFLEGLAVDAKAQVFYAADHARDTVWAIPLGPGKVRFGAGVAPNPRAMALTGKQLLVGSLQSGEVEVLELPGGKVLRSIEPGPGTPIFGGRTAAFSKSVMNGKAPRSLVYSSALKVAFAASIGPNIGPNADKMEVTQNPGVAVLDVERGTFVRHLGFGEGLSEALALDDARGLLYVADVGLGLVRVLDTKALRDSPRPDLKAVVQTIALVPPSDFPLVRDRKDFEVAGRAGLSLHSGPKALALSKDGRRLYALNRFTGTVAVLDTSVRGRARHAEQILVVDTRAQKQRRLGQVLFYADLAKTAVTCDSCHLEGHTEGVFFEKTEPLRIYRASTVRGARETPPYFTPASTKSMGETMRVVGGRNRFHAAELTPSEVDALTVFGSSLTSLPNPFVDAHGVPLTTLLLPDGQTGRPEQGRALFEGKADCASCHPSPLFTLDQTPSTRGQYIDVGTPHLLPLREKLQNGHFEGFSAPSLSGAWDIFPMLTTGAAGLEVGPSEAVRRSKSVWHLRRAVEDFPKHGKAAALTKDERNDLLAYVMTL